MEDNEKLYEAEVCDGCDDDLVEYEDVDPDCKKRMDRNHHWSVEFKKGYATGYQSAKAKWTTVMDKAMKEKDRESRELSGIYPYNVIEEVLNGYGNKVEEYDISPAQIRKTIQTVLTERESRILELRYGWGLSLEETGRRFKVTRERIRQVEAKALRKLHRPDVLKGMQCVPRKEYDKVLERNEYLSHENIQLRNLLATDVGEKRDDIAVSLAAARVLADKTNDAILDTNIIELGLSVRAYNCMIRSGVKTLGQLAEVANDNERLMKVRNLGRKSAEEIIEKIKAYGLYGDGGDVNGE